MIFRQLFDRDTCTYTYLVADEATRRAALVDTVLEQVDRDIELARELDVTLAFVLETHVHADHVTGAGEIRKRTGVRTATARASDTPCADLALGDGDVVTLGPNTDLRVLATPGHTASCLTYAVACNAAVDRLLTGDALLIRGCGRTDFQGGDAHALYASIRDKLFAFPDATLVFPAHDYTGRLVSTVGEEKRHNPRIGGTRTLDEFVTIMAHLNLAPPAKLDVAVPANQACGEVLTRA